MSRAAELIVIGGSAGSFGVLLSAFSRLDFLNDLAIVVVMHRNKDSNSTLADLFSHRTKLAVKEAEEKEEIKAGVIYLAPADYHLLIEKNKTFSMDYSEKINFSRPCIDATFQTAANAYGNKLIGVLLSGSNADGVEGLKAVKELGGMVVVQDPQSCVVPYMTNQAILNVQTDAIIDGETLADFIKNIQNRP